MPNRLTVAATMGFVTVRCNVKIVDNHTCAWWDSNPQITAFKAAAYTNSATRAVKVKAS